ncbi:MAG: hypothetical protein ACKKL4_01675 [Patescibacteria group bacterium]
MSNKKVECPKCGDFITTPVCRRCGIRVRALTALERESVGGVPEPDIEALRRAVRAVTYATPGDRLSVASGDG